MDHKALEMWTIYDHPKDMPDHFVARCFLIDHGVQATQAVVTFDNLRAVRNHFRDLGMTCLPRFPDDDPVIVETWL
jgi:hypothetical protein